ncbi:MAG: hypothetical protein WCD11_11330 [Solirubrobacteraceae bacterium]
MTISPAQRHETETRIRAAASRLLGGEIPPGGKCDVKTLAAEAQVSRAGLYRSYLPLKLEFERRAARLRADGQVPDPRETQIKRLQDENASLRARITELQQKVTAFERFETTAISRLAVLEAERHELETRTADRSRLRVLPTPSAGG